MVLLKKLYIIIVILCYKKKYNTDKTELQNKIPDISNLATKNAVTAVENKITSVSNLVKKTYHNTKITDIENKLNNHDYDKYIDTSEFSTLTTNVFNARLVQANLITKTDFDAKLLSLNRKITKNKTDHLTVKNELHKLKMLILVILLKKVILKKMVHKLI